MTADYCRVNLGLVVIAWSQHMREHCTPAQYISRHSEENWVVPKGVPGWDGAWSGQFRNAHYR